MTDREKARDLGNQSAALARSIADVLNDTLDALEAAEARVAQLQAALRDCLLALDSLHDSPVLTTAASTARAALADLPEVPDE